MKYLLVLALILAVFFDGVSDGLIDKNKKRSHWMELLLVVAFIAVAGLSVLVVDTIIDFIMYVGIMYIMQRFLFFDIFYNAAKGEYLDFVGTTWSIDKWVRRIDMSFFFWLWVRFIVWIGYTLGVMWQYN